MDAISSRNLTTALRISRNARNIDDSCRHIRDRHLRSEPRTRMHRGRTCQHVRADTGGTMGSTRRTPRTRAAGTRVAGMALLAALAAAACAPPAPNPPRWTTTRLARTASPTEVVNRFGAWTDDDWFATVRVVTPIGGAGTSISLDVHPRQGAGGTQLGTPQSLPLTADVGFGGPSAST